VALTSLRLNSFRNLVDQRVELPPEGVAIIGDNGQGKTSLLEAIYYLEIFKSFRGAADEQLVRFGEGVFRVEGETRREGRADRVAAAFDAGSRRKKVTLNGVEPPRLADALGTIGVVVFSPSDVAIVNGGPGERRRFLDIVLSLTVPGYLHALQKYRHVLAQRNALLRKGAPAMVVSAWDPGLVDWGSRVMAARWQWVGDHSAAFAEHVRNIADGASGSIHYEPSARLPRETGGQTPADEAAAAFTSDLERVRERETRRGATLVGPHRDDLRIRGADPQTGAWNDLRTFGSGGQQRTAAIALRMMEAGALRAASGREPIILLDDVFAELDPGRSRRILDWIERRGSGQVILTAPKPTDVELHGNVLRRWSIHQGVLSEL
jgi:DNA replication and repair protein RecF